MYLSFSISTIFLGIGNMTKARLRQCYLDFKQNLKLSLSRFKTEKRQRQREF